MSVEILSYSVIRVIFFIASFYVRFSTLINDRVLSLMGQQLHDTERTELYRLLTEKNSLPYRHSSSLCATANY